MPYKEEYRKDFVEISTAWLEKYFRVEDGDVREFDSLSEIVTRGGMAYFAVEDGVVISTCMIHEIEDGVWEPCKLGTREGYEGRGAGRAVFEACMEYAKARGARKLVIVSNSVLSGAMHIYATYGFREVPLDKEKWGYDRADIQFELDVARP